MVESTSLETGVDEVSTVPREGSIPSSDNLQIIDVDTESQDDNELSIGQYKVVDNLDMADDVMVRYRGGELPFRARVMNIDKERQKMDVMQIEETVKHGRAL